MLGDLGVIFIDILDAQRSHAGEAALTLMSGIVYNLANTLLVMHPFEQYINCMRDLGITGARVNAAKHINTFELAALAGKIVPPHKEMGGNAK